MIELNNIYCLDNIVGIGQLDSETIDLTVTSPPYDNLRDYNGFSWNFEELSKELFRVTKQGGVLVWVVGDSTSKFSESLTSFKQAIYFTDVCGFNLLDTMIYKKKSYAPAYPTLRRYAGVFEYMFVFSKGRPKTFNSLKELKSTNPSTLERKKYSLQTSMRQKDGSKVIKKVIDNGSDYKDKTNIWEYIPSGNYANDKFSIKHPAPFPEKLAEDHILTWSNEGDLVFDPFSGSGTTAKMAKLNNRKYIGFDISQEYVDIASKRVESE